MTVGVYRQRNRQLPVYRTIRAFSVRLESQWHSLGLPDLIQDSGQEGRPTSMSRTLSTDLRERVVAAVSGGMSRRRAAERFGVSPASAVRLCARARATGSVAAKPRGGDRLSRRIECRRSAFSRLSRRRTTSRWPRSRRILPRTGIASASARSGGFSPSAGSCGKKDRSRDGAGPAGHPEAEAGLVRRPARPRPSASRVHRRNLGVDQHGPSLRADTARRAAALGRAAWPLESHDIHRRSAA